MRGRHTIKGGINKREHTSCSLGDGDVNGGRYSPIL